MSPALFKKCYVKDPHSSCLLCLGDTHNFKACPLCKSLTLQARKNPDSRLIIAIYQEVLKPQQSTHPASALATSEATPEATGSVAQSSTTEPSATVTQSSMTEPSATAKKASKGHEPKGSSWKPKSSKKDKAKSKDSSSKKISVQEASSREDSSSKSSKKRHRPSDTGDGSPQASAKKSKLSAPSEASVQPPSHMKAHSKSSDGSSHKKTHRVSSDTPRPPKNLASPLVPTRVEPASSILGSPRTISVPASVPASTLSATLAYHHSDDDDGSASRSPHRCSPTPVPQVQIHQAQVHHQEDLDYYHDSKTEKYFVAVSQDVAHSRLASRFTVPALPPRSPNQDDPLDHQGAETLLH
ncbi:uncharacterized protein LOC121927528 [Sceloporus undulatus]|uniref:uncharacterized protein LOC121927528 n=1 Tax=Sceloporus undulatus TaxID=8520 RepID=UPI001C4AD519|nr:uncharacterized protein LOC121927528 [Sceloporus undulatus]